MERCCSALGRPPAFERSFFYLEFTWRKGQKIGDATRRMETQMGKKMDNEVETRVKRVSRK